MGRSFELAVFHRAAFWTIRAEEAAGASELFQLTGSKPEDIDVVMTVDEVDVEKQQQALDCMVYLMNKLITLSSQIIIRIMYQVQLMVVQTTLSMVILLC